MTHASRAEFGGKATGHGCSGPHSERAMAKERPRRSFESARGLDDILPTAGSSLPALNSDATRHAADDPTTVSDFQGTSACLDRGTPRARLDAALLSSKAVWDCQVGSLPPLLCQLLQSLPKRLFA